MKKINIYGDNILECERAIDLLEKAIALNEGSLEKKIINGNPLVPSFNIDTQSNRYLITMFPGISNNRWDYNIYDEIITKNGGTLLEGADAVITVEGCDDFGYYEIPLLAIEFSSALPAGNNSWQRSGRALSFSQANIPYIYSTEIGGIELDSKGNKKSVRWPSSALILSYILNSKRNNTISLIHYSFSPVADSNIRSDYSFLNDNSTIFELIYKGIKNHQLLLSDATNILKTDEEIYLKRAKKTENYKIINGNFDADQVITGTKNQKLTWKKKVSIPTSDSFSALNKLLEKGPSPLK